MSHQESKRPETNGASIDLEQQGIEVRRLGASLCALATLMQASDPMQTEGDRDTPILHGLGYLVEVLGKQFRAHGTKIEDSAAQVRSDASPSVPTKRLGDDPAALRRWSRALIESGLVKQVGGAS